MIATNKDLIPAITEQTSLADRFILTQVDRQTLVFPATWVAEILRIDRSQILSLPFYDSLLVGIANYNGKMTPLIAAARLLELEQFTVPERVMVVRLNQTAGQLENVGIIVDRAIGSSTRDELPCDLFITNSAHGMVMMRSQLVPTSLWQPQYWSASSQ
jgi:chemotaxis signal transduction protein